MLSKINKVVHKPGSRRSLSKLHFITDNLSYLSHHTLFRHQSYVLLHSWYLFLVMCVFWMNTKQLCDLWWKFIKHGNRITLFWLLGHSANCFQSLKIPPIIAVHFAKRWWLIFFTESAINPHVLFSLLCFLYVLWFMGADVILGCGKEKKYIVLQHIKEQKNSLFLYF